MEITPPSIQRQQIAELEKNNLDLMEQQMKVTTSNTTTKHGNEIIVSTLSPHEQQTFTFFFDIQRRLFLREKRINCTLSNLWKSQTQRPNMAARHCRS
ncbi:hypothetical protein PFDG_05134, partial [Plasmodium falciparum Dd2]